MKTNRNKFLLCLLLGASLALMAGCAAYQGVIGHPLHVLREQHQYNERQEEARKLGEAMYRDTHPDQ